MDESPKEPSRDLPDVQHPPSLEDVPRKDAPISESSVPEIPPPALGFDAADSVSLVSDDPVPLGPPLPPPVPPAKIREPVPFHFHGST